MQKHVRLLLDVHDDHSLILARKLFTNKNFGVRSLSVVINSALGIVRVHKVVPLYAVKLFREGREGMKKSRKHGAIHTIANQSSTRTKVPWCFEHHHYAET